NQEFNASYQLLKQVTDGEVRTFHALAATGAVVMVHLLRAEPDNSARELIALIDRLPPSQRERVLTVTDVEGTPLVVTRFLLEFSTLRDWLVKSVADGGSAQSADTHATVYQRVPGIATTPSPPATLTSAGSPTMQPPAAQATPAPSAPTSAPSAPPPPAPTPVSPPPQASPSPSAPAREPGEFTRLFGAVQPPTTPPTATPPPATSTQPAMESPRLAAHTESAAAPPRAPGECARPS